MFLTHFTIRGACSIKKGVPYCCIFHKVVGLTGNIRVPYFTKYNNNKESNASSICMVITTIFHVITQGAMKTLRAYCADSLYSFSKLDTELIVYTNDKSKICHTKTHTTVRVITPNPIINIFE